ncbi:hypothetical protein ACIBEJ_34430 [Nonomuraea sp. NPDC050790]|uniref:hypothetical protein n=1 Tax=Nonomuraea sp. NPDC050790 TaxID=3364371 RepID=UPI003789DD0F
MTDPHVNISLTFRTPAPTAAVLESILAAINQHAMPYELAAAHCNAFDMDEVEE